jgi:arylsulfatase A-like enzyme
MRVIFLVVDSLRADALGCYGGPQATLTVDALAAGGARFETVVSSAPWTVPSLGAMLTGIWSHRLGLLQWQQPWPSGVATLFDAVHRSRLETASFVFDPDHLFRSCPEAGVVGSSQDTEAILAWFRARRHSDYFAFVHYWWTHVPYLRRKLPLPDWNRVCQAILQQLSATDPPQREANRAKVKGLYALAVREWSELWLPALLDAAQADVVVLISDHGESWGERLPVGAALEDVFDLHGNHLHDEVLRIPWILYAPGLVKPVAVAGLARSVDVMPTLIDLLELEARHDGDEKISGRSLVSSLVSGAIGRQGPAMSARTHDFVEADTVPTEPGEVYVELACQDLATKVIMNFAGDEAHTYDLLVDPGEQAPLAVPSAEAQGFAQALRDERANAVVAPSAPEDFALMRRQLEKLGYL